MSSVLEGAWALQGSVSRGVGGYVWAPRGSGGFVVGRRGGGGDGLGWVGGSGCTSWVGCGGAYITFRLDSVARDISLRTGKVKPPPTRCGLDATAAAAAADGTGVAVSMRAVVSSAEQASLAHTPLLVLKGPTLGSGSEACRVHWHWQVRVIVLVREFPVRSQSLRRRPRCGPALREGAVALCGGVRCFLVLPIRLQKQPLLCPQATILPPHSSISAR